jgi:hypothetical protein
MIHEWERQYPGRIDNMLTAMGNVVPSHLMDRNLYPFETLQGTRRGRPGATAPSTTTTTPAPRRRRQRCRSSGAALPRRRTCMKRRLPCWPSCRCRAGRLRRLNTVTSDVSSFGDWPAGRAPAATPSSACPRSRRRPPRPTRWRPPPARRWRRPASCRPRPGPEPDVLVQVGARFTRSGARPGTTRCGGAAASAAAPRPVDRPDLGRWPALESVALRQRGGAAAARPASGKPLYESPRRNEGSTGGGDELLAALFQASLIDFPRHGPNPRTVHVTLP